MEYEYLGVITTTHGIKGEVKIKSNFERKEQVLVEDFPIYIGLEKRKEIINTHRIHKGLDMVTFKGIEDINEVLKYKGQKVYVKRADLNLAGSEYLLSDLRGFRIVQDNKDRGIVKDIIETKAGILLEVEFKKKYYIPFNKEFIKKVHKEQKEIEGKRVEELYEI